MMGRMTRRLMAMPAHINAREDRALGNVPDMPMRGRMGDDRMAMLTPEQMAALGMMGGAGTRNPMTGMPEFWDGGTAEGDSGTGGMTGGDFGMGDVGVGGWGGDFDQPGSGQAGYGMDAMGPSANAATGPGNYGGPSISQFGMDPDSALDRAIARVGTAIGLPPDPSRASPMAVMGMLGAPLPGLLGSRMAAGAFPGMMAGGRRGPGNPQNQGDGFTLAELLLAPRRA